MSTELVNPGVSDEAAMWLFLRSLRASRLLTDEDLDVLSKSVLPEQIDAVYAMLVNEQLLTPYQLHRIRSGTPDGLVLGQYQILDELGRGGFGQVFKARHAMMNRVVALKVIAPSQARERMVRDLFVREVAVSTRLTHPNIAQGYDANEIDGVLFYAMEYVPGPTLENHVGSRGPLSIPLVRTLLTQAGRALEFSHSQGVVHRDIKPANILLPGLAGSPHPASTFAKIVDFGLARAFSRGTDPTSTIFCPEGAIVGTPAYMAPEQALNVHDTDIRSDLYSLGCTAYFAITGRAPFRGLNTQQVFAMSRSQEPEPMQNLRRDVPADLVDVVRRLMSKDPAERYQTPTEMIEAVSAPVPGWDAPLPDGVTPFAGVPDGEPVEAIPTVCLPVQVDTPVPVSTGSDAPAPDTDLWPSPPHRCSLGLSEVWAEWYGVVNRLSRGTDTTISEHEYKALHRCLLSAAIVPDAATRTQTVLCHHVRAVVEPWVTLRSLTDLDRRTRSELRDACRRVDDLFPSPGMSVFSRCLAAAALVALPAVLGVGFVRYLGG